MTKSRRHHPRAWDYLKCTDPSLPYSSDWTWPTGRLGMQVGKGDEAVSERELEAFCRSQGTSLEALSFELGRVLPHPLEEVQKWLREHQPGKERYGLMRLDGDIDAFKFPPARRFQELFGKSFEEVRGPITNNKRPVLPLDVLGPLIQGISSSDYPQVYCGMSPPVGWEDYRFPNSSEMWGKYDGRSYSEIRDDPKYAPPFSKVLEAIWAWRRMESRDPNVFVGRGFRGGGSYIADSCPSRRAVAAKARANTFGSSNNTDNIRYGRFIKKTWRRVPLASSMVNIYGVGLEDIEEAGYTMRPKTEFGLSSSAIKQLTTGARVALDILRFAACRRAEGVTADECAVALKVAHQSCSARFNELVGAGCLIKTQHRRTTRMKKNAAVYDIASGASLTNFFLWRSLPKKKVSSSLSAQDQASLAAAHEFIASWPRAQSAKAREKVVTRLLKRLRTLMLVVHETGQKEEVRAS